MTLYHRDAEAQSTKKKTFAFVVLRSRCFARNEEKQIPGMTCHSDPAGAGAAQRKPALSRAKGICFWLRPKSAPCLGASVARFVDFFTFVFLEDVLKFPVDIAEIVSQASRRLSPLRQADLI